MQLTVRQKMLAFGKQYRAIDAHGRQLYEVTSAILSADRRKEVRDMDGRLLAWCEWPVMTGHAEWECGPLRGGMEIPFMSFSPEWEMNPTNGDRYTMTGDMLRQNFTVQGPAGTVATIGKRFLAFTDTYEVETIDSGFPMELALLLTALVDHKYHSDNG